MISVTGDAVLLEFGTGSGLSSSSSATDASVMSGGGGYAGDLGFGSVSGSARMSSVGLDYAEGNSSQQNAL
jgi:hypothetical protein